MQLLTREGRAFEALGELGAKRYSLCVVINTGQRCDIPAFFPLWLARRLDDCFVMARSPYDPGSIYRYVLDPSVVDVISFCSKNPAPLLPYWEKLRKYRMVWHVTITPYGRDIEPKVPRWTDVASTVQWISSRAGRSAVFWRYDPVLFVGEINLEWHKEAFAAMAERIAPSVGAVVVSYVDLYGKVKRNFPGLGEVPWEAKEEFTRFAVEVAGKYGIPVRLCAEDPLLGACGAEVSGCMTGEVINAALGLGMDFPKNTRGRKECACHLSADIGAYDCCPHFCRYCYANSSREAVMGNLSLHDDSSPLLVGWPGEGDRIIEAKQKSWIPEQGELF